MINEQNKKLPLIKMAANEKKQRREISTFFKIFLTSWAFMENGLFSGLRAGWSALVYILKQEQVYADLCDSHSTENSTTGPPTQTINLFTDSGGATGPSSAVYLTSTQGFTTTPQSGCDEQDAVFNQCFTVASATMALSALLYGHLNYKFGIRAPRVLSVVIFVGGSCCFAFVDKELPWLIFPGLLLISSGGMALYITNNQISYMFSTGSAAVVGLLCGALEASAIVQTIIKILYEHGISLFISYLTLGGMYTLILISTFCFLPKDYITSERTDNSIENVVNSEDVESARDQENVPIIGNAESINKATLVNKGGIISIKGSNSFADNSSVSDFDNSKQTTEIEAAASKDESHNNAITHQISDGKCEQTSQSDTDPGKIETLEENEHFYKEDDNSDMEGDLLQIQSGTLQSDSPVHRQGTKVRSEITTQKITSQTNDKNIEEENTEISHSTVHAGGISGEMTLLKCILTKTFFLYLYWAASVQIILSMSLGTFNPWLEYVTNNNKSKVSEFTDILFYSMLGSPVLALCFGLSMDALKRVRSNDDTPSEVRTLHTAIVSLGLTSILGVILCGLFMTCQNDAIIGTSIILVLFRTGLYSCGTAFLRLMYPTNYFGILCGIMTVLSGGISYVQYPLFLWVQYRNQAWIEVFGFIGVIGLVSLVQPTYLLWKCRLYRKAPYSNMRNDKFSNRLKNESPDIHEIE